MSGNPEDKVIDAIDALVDWQLAHGPECACPVCPGFDDDDCPVCHHDWHGTPEWGCPGAFGTDAEIERFHSQYDLDLPNSTWLDPNFDVTTWFGDTESLSVTEGYRYQGIGFVAGAPWIIPALDTRRIRWNVT